MGFTLNQHEQEKQIKRLQQKEDHDTTDYESLENLPDINGVELKGNKSLSDLGIQGDSLEAACGERLTLGPTVEGLALLTKAYGMSVQDGTPTPSSPVDIESAKADFRSVGKNLIPYPYYETESKTYDTVTFTLNADSSITVNTSSAATQNTTYWISRPFKYITGRYFIKGTGDSNVCVCVGKYLGSAWKAQVNAYVDDTYIDLDTDDNTYDRVWIGVHVSKGKSVNNVTVYPLVGLWGISDTYEPYTKYDTTTDLTLRAIEVTSSDAYNLVRDNKYYIADTLDYSDDSGFVVTRRIGHIASYDSETLTTKWMSSKDVYASGTNPSSGATVDYILATPTTETITTAQALALLGLKTYDESTTISSQAEPACTVAVEYAKERLGAVALSAYNKAVADGLSIAAIKSHILPDAPSTDGSYNLKVTVTSGESAYSWEAVTP